MMTERILPEESKSQEIGHYAVIAFNSLYPVDWHSTPTEGDSDAGLDMQIQIVNRNRYKGIFHAQIKGSKQRSKDGSNKKLSAEKQFFSQELAISTLNYYLRVANPVMLVFVDLTVDPDPRKCNAYYLWLHDELDNLRDDHKSLDHIEKESHTFRIPITNVLDKTLDVMPYLTVQYEKRHALESLYSSISTQGKEPIATVGQLGSKFASSPIALDSVLAETNNPWLEAPPDSVAGKLHVVSNYLSVNNADLATSELDIIKERIHEASDHEQAEYCFQKARLAALIGNHREAIPLYEEAHSKVPDVIKYHISLIEEKLLDRYDEEEFVRQILNEIHENTGPEFSRIKVKLYAFLQDFDRAKDVLEQEADKEVFVVRALFYFLKGDYEHCAQYCEESLLRNELTKRQQLSLLMFRARALFNIGGGNTIEQYPGEVIPFSGLPCMDAEHLGKSWGDLKQAWALAGQLGYPADIEYVLDVSCILSVYFNEKNYFYTHLKYLAKIRPHAPYIQETLLKYALNLDDLDVVQEQLNKVPEEPSTIVHKILSFYRLSRKNLVVQTAAAHIEDIYEAKSDNLDIALAVAAECADDLIRTEERNRFLEYLAALPNGKSMLAVYEFITTVNKNLLSIPEALEKLWKAYGDGEKDKQILAQLFDHLDIAEEIGAERAIAVATDIVAQRQLTEKETVRLCQALSRKARWEDVVSTATEALRRFDKSIRLRAIRAMGLDELGHTPEALELLEETIDESQYDPYAFELYAQIAARCGLTEKSLGLFEALLEHSKERKQKARILRIMFILHMSLDPESNRLLDVCSRYGEVNARNDECEEGIFLQLFFAATINEKVKPSEKQVSDFQQRLQNFQKKFPASRFMRGGAFDKDSPAEFLKQLEEFTGMTEGQRRWYQRSENLMKVGEIPVPFCLRPRALLNVPNLLYLWEIGKHVSRDDRQYHLMISAESFKHREQEDYLPKRILIDNIAILVLFDLDLLEACLSILPQVAIAKSTLTQFQLWSQNVFMSPLSEKAKRIMAILAKHIKKIEQPSAIQTDDENEYDATLDEQKRLMEKGRYVFYSDDALARIWVCGEDDPKRSLATIDIIELLTTQGKISRLEAAKKYSTLCRWNVNGMPVRYIDVLRVLVPYVKPGLTIEEAVDRLEKSEEFNSYIDAIWDIRKDYKSILKEASEFLGFILSESEEILVDDQIITALWYWWFRKVQFKNEGEVAKLDYLARSCWAAAVNLTRCDDPGKHWSRWSKRLWGIYRDIVQYVYGAKMDERVEREMYRQLAKFTVTSDRSVSDNVYGFLMEGLESGTKEADTFSNFYGRAAIERRTTDEQR